MSAASDRMHDSITETFRDLDHMVIKWTLVAEAISETGSSDLWILQSPDLSAWDSMGMHEYALASERGAVTVRIANDEEADDEEEDA